MEGRELFLYLLLLSCLLLKIILRSKCIFGGAMFCYLEETHVYHSGSTYWVLFLSRRGREMPKTIVFLISSLITFRTNCLKGSA